MQTVGTQYMADNPRIGLVLTGGGSARGYKAVLDGTADIGMASGEMPEEMVEWAGRQPIGLRRITVAYDGVAAIVHPANPLGDISFAQLSDIFEGAVTDWSELGVPPRKIMVYSQDPLQGTYEAWTRLVAVNGGLLTPRALVVPGGDIVERVAGDISAIGYASPMLVDPHRAKILRIGGSLPVAGDIAAGRYPVRRNLDLLTAARPNAAVSAFTAYCLAPGKGQLLLERAGVVPVKAA